MFSIEWIDGVWLNLWVGNTEGLKYSFNDLDGTDKSRTGTRSGGFMYGMSFGKLSHDIDGAPR